MSNFEQISAVYQNANNLSLFNHRIAHPKLQLFSRQLQEFIFNLGEDREIDDWSLVLKNLRGLRFRISFLPLRQDILIELIENCLRELALFLEKCLIVYPNYYDQLSKLYKELQGLKETDLEKINSKIIELVSTSSQRVGIHVKADSKLVELAQTSFTGDRIQVFGTSTLKKLDLFDQLFLVGPCPSRWQPDFAIMSPRAPVVHAIYYGWLGEMEFQRAFQASLLNGPTVSRHFGISQPSISDDDLDFQYSEIVNRAKKFYEHNRSDREFVDALLFGLEDDKHVFLDVNAEVQVLDLFDVENPLKRERVENLSEGDFLLLRTKRGGDFIVPTADQILGENAPELRNAQRLWKERLRSLVDRIGMKHAVKELINNGSAVAKPINVRNWMSYRSIKTENLADFAAIMKLIENVENTNDLWDKMRRIHHAHHQAGQQIRRQLLEVVKNTDLSILEKNGAMEFNIPGEDSGGLGAFRIVSRMAEKIQVPTSNIGLPSNEFVDRENVIIDAIF